MVLSEFLVLELRFKYKAIMNRQATDAVWALAILPPRELALALCASCVKGVSYRKQHFCMVLGNVITAKRYFKRMPCSFGPFQ